MYMIDDTVNCFRHATQSTNCAAQIFMQPATPFNINQWCAVFCRKDEVIMKTGICRRHGEIKPLWHPSGVRKIFYFCPGVSRVRSTPGYHLEPLRGRIDHTSPYRDVPGPQEYSRDSTDSTPNYFPLKTRALCSPDLFRNSTMPHNSDDDQHQSQDQAQCGGDVA